MDPRYNQLIVDSLDLRLATLVEFGPVYWYRIVWIGAAVPRLVQLTSSLKLYFGSWTLSLVGFLPDKVECTSTVADVNVVVSKLYIYLDV